METRFLLFIAAVFAARLPTSRQFQDELNYELPALKNDTESVSARADGEVADCEFGTSCLCKCKPKEGVEPEFCEVSQLQKKAPIQCPATWVQLNSKCFKNFAERLTQPEALRVCEKFGGSLASLHSEIEVKFASDNKLYEGDAWLGGYVTSDVNSREKLKGWGWTDGSPWDFINWLPHEPNNAGGNERCVAAWAGKWNDLPCSVPKRFLCSIS